jgi:hypothetical protein
MFSSSRRAGVPSAADAAARCAERAPSGQAKCRSCHTPIERGSWRIRLVLHDEGVFSPGGFIHAGCRQAYFETADILEQVLHFSPELVDADRDALREYFRKSGATTS